MKHRSLAFALFLSAGCAQGDSLDGSGGESEGGSGPNPDGGNGHEGGSPPQGAGIPQGAGPQGGDGPQGAGPSNGGGPSTGGGNEGGAPASCGDGVLNGGETCDGAQLGGATCVSQGFDSGTLACNSNCLSYNTAGCSNTCTPVNLLTLNPGFENGPNGGGWTETSTNFGSPVCSAADCGLGGGTGPFAGTFWAWFGGTATALETATVSRSVVIPTGTATLTFQFDLPVCEDPFWASDLFTAKIDGVTLFSATNTDAGCGSVGYQLVSIDVSAYANGASHTLSFSGTTDDYIDATNFFIDDVQILGCP